MSQGSNDVSNFIRIVFISHFLFQDNGRKSIVRGSSLRFIRLLFLLIF